MQDGLYVGLHTSWGISMAGLRKQDRELGIQVDLVEQMSNELLKEMAELKAALQKLKFKKVQLLKQIANMVTVIEEKKK